MTPDVRRQTLLDILRMGPVVPVLIIDKVETAVPLAKALVAGGVRTLEVTLRTDAALEVIKVLAAEVPDYLLQILARFARYLRESQSIDQRSGVSARFAIAAAETVGAAAQHRSAILGEQDPVARVVDLQTIIGVLRGKLEFESGEEGREQAVLEHLLRRATADTAQRLLGGIDVGSLVVAVEGDSPVTTGERVSAKDVLAALPDLPVIDAIADRLGAQSDGERAAAVELALEALYLAKRIDKTSDDGETVYG